jgi:hypothetical protein
MAATCIVGPATMLALLLLLAGSAVTLSPSKPPRVVVEGTRGVAGAILLLASRRHVEVQRIGEAGVMRLRGGFKAKWHTKYIPHMGNVMGGMTAEQERQEERNKWANFVAHRRRLAEEEDKAIELGEQMEREMAKEMESSGQEQEQEQEGEGDVVERRRLDGRVEGKDDVMDGGGSIEERDRGDGGSDEDEVEDDDDDGEGGRAGQKRGRSRSKAASPHEGGSTFSSKKARRGGRATSAAGEEEIEEEEIEEEQVYTSIKHPVSKRDDDLEDHHRVRDHHRDDDDDDDDDDNRRVSQRATLRFPPKSSLSYNSPLPQTMLPPSPRLPVPSIVCHIPQGGVKQVCLPSLSLSLSLFLPLLTIYVLFFLSLSLSHYEP